MDTLHAHCAGLDVHKDSVVACVRHAGGGGEVVRTFGTDARSLLMLGDFLAGRPSAALGEIVPSYRPGVTPTDLSVVLPDYAIAAIREALPAFGRQIPGFDHPDAVLTGVETRTSSPVRVTRGKDFQSLNTAGLFDKMLIRFSSDKGSTLARYATFDFLSHFDRHELLFGPDPVRASALQDALGLKYGVEDFWVSCIVQFGIISTSILTIGLAALLAEIIKRASAAAWLILLLMIIIAISSVSFSSNGLASVLRASWTGFSRSS